jgi:hypothetical protein
VSDVGCILDKHWLENITDPFNNSAVDVVAGFYHAKTESVFEKCLATYTCVMPDKVDKQNFLPSSRSIAFTKYAWEKVGGYPEYLNTCEDLVFAKKLKEKKIEFTVAKDALVYWPQRKNIFQAFIQFYSYAVGDGQAFFMRAQTPLLYLRFLVFTILVIELFLSSSRINFFILILLFVLYTLYAIVKNYRYVKNNQAFFYLPLLQYTSDIAVFLGTTIGIIKRIKNNEYR